MSEHNRFWTPALSGPAASEDWQALQLHALSFSRWEGGASIADDVAQEALARLMKALRSGVLIDNVIGYLRIIVRNVVRSAGRRARQSIVAPIDTIERIHDMEAPCGSHATEEALHRGPGLLADAAREISRCLEIQPEGDLALAYLFRSVIAPESCASLDLPESTAVTRRERRALLSAAKALACRGIDADLMVAVLTTPAATIAAPWLTNAITRFAAGVLENVQTVSRKCRLDILFRAGIDRQELHAARLPLFVRDLDALYAAALLPRCYTLRGMVMCLCRRVGSRPTYADLLDPGYAERLALDLIHRKPGLNPMDRWLAIVCLGVLYEQFPVAISYVDRILGPIESSASLHPVQKVGLSFAWIDATERQKQLVIREKVYPLLDPLRWPGGLSQLPITVIGSYMGSTPGKLAAALAREESWMPIVYGLTSAS